MKTVVLTSSSTKSSTASTMEDDRSETRDTSYFPGCRKDANCNCEMCLASINATLDLMPFSNQRSSLSNFSFSKPFPRSPVAFDPSILSTPRSNARRIPESPSLRSTARLNFREKVKEKKKRRGFGIGILRLVLILCLIYAAQIGFPWMVSRVFGPKLSPDIVRNLGEKSWVMQDLSGRFVFLQKELQGFVDGKISRCSYTNSTWKMTQDGLLLNSRCTLYKSATEEVSIWGWPLQTAGLLTTGLSSRSFTILSGRVTEWLDGKNGYSIRKANSSWVHRKWSTSLVQLNPNTWVLEYQRSQILENTKLLSAALEFLNFRISREIGRLKREFWLLSAFVNQFGEYSTRTPTPT